MKGDYFGEKTYSTINFEKEKETFLCHALFFPQSSVVFRAFKSWNKSSR